MSKKPKQAATVEYVPTLEYIKLDIIHPSPLNPRKEFHEEPLAELVESIKKLGVIQPITVRKVSGRETSPGVILLGDSYELVCGERRLRSAKIAGITEIPCSVRILTDAEAMELMITENLQRKDVSPLEEADAFRYMLDHMNYEIADVAGRIAKNEVFVTRRLQLIKLIPDLKEAFISGFISIGHAELLCRIQPEDQQYWYTQEAKGYNGAGTVKSLRQHLNSKVEKKLAKAKFDTTTPMAETIACTECPANSACNASLFPDRTEEAICHNSACFNRKTEAAFTTALEIALADPYMLLAEQYSEAMPVVAKLKKDGYTLLKQYDDYNTEYVKKPELPRSSDAGYAENLKRYQDDIFEYDSLIRKISAGEADIKKAFVVCGSDRGSTIFIKLKSSKAVMSAARMDSDIVVKEQKAKITQKIARGRELDLEKLHKVVVPHVCTLPIVMDFNSTDWMLSPVESAAFTAMAYESISYSFKAKKQIDKLLKIDSGNSYYRNGSGLLEKIAAAPNEVRAFIVRAALISKYASAFPTSLGGAITFSLAKDWDLETYQKMFDEQDAIKERRESKLNIQLKELEGDA